MRRSGVLLVGNTPIQGNYECTVCGFCCMHHEGPICEEAQWVRVISHGCRFCGAPSQPFRLCMQRQRWTFDVGRVKGLNADNQRHAGAYGTYRQSFVQLGLTPIVPTTDFHRLTYNAATDEEKWEALRGLRR